MAWATGLFVTAVLAFATAASGSDTLDYDGYQVFRIMPQTQDNVTELMASLEDLELDIWSPSRGPGDAADVMVNPEKVSFFQDFVTGLRLNTSVLIDDVQELIQGRGQSSGNQQSSAFDWKEYHTLESINGWLKEQAKVHKDIATIISAGKTYEGREILGLRIAHKTNLPIVFIEAGIHAREWISPATATWLIKEALQGKKEALKAYEWHVFPSVNPDGYAYTQKTRLWRKNRRPVSSQCIGVDLNRNYPYKWISDKPHCSELYSGPNAGSEAETKGLMAYLNNILGRVRVYISLHSYRQLLMYPWGYTRTLPRNNGRFNEIAKKATTQLRTVDGVVYRYGPIATTIYPAPGNTVDYAYSVNISYPFVFELRDTGKYGFLLPSAFIIPTANETLSAVSVILQEALKN